MNKKITLYELLGLIKDGKAPKKIKYNGIKWYFDDLCDDYTDKIEQCLFCDYIDHKWYVVEILNDEVEILDNEDMEIEEIKYYDDSIAWVIDGAGQLSDVDKVAIDKINELVREVNKLKKEVNNDQTRY